MKLRLPRIFRNRATEALRSWARRWTSADTDRTNVSQWNKATANPINQDLAGRLDTLRARATHEAANNPFVEGVMLSHSFDVVGPDGPTLQVTSSSTEYNAALESWWRYWWQSPDLNGQLSGCELLQLWVRSLWTDGEYLAQIVSDAPTADNPISLRLHNVAPRRLRNPWGGFQTDTSLGVKRDRNGKPTAYYIEDANDGEFSAWLSQPREIAAAFILHDFIPMEAGQARGVPLLATTLQSTRDLRDYDQYVLDAAKWAASHSALLTTTDPNAVPVQFTGTVEVERNMIAAAPPGYSLSQMATTQPQAQYANYRMERLRELGRPVGMPLMMIMLDSSRHNYSSARFDAQTYWRGVKSLQQRISRRTLNRVLSLLVRELQLLAVAGKIAEKVLANPPEDVRFAWTWQPVPHVDPQKEAAGDQIDLEMGVATYGEKCAKRGTDFEAVTAARDKEERVRNEQAVARIVTLQEQIKKANAADPELKLHWAHIVSIGGAISAPGAYLQAASPQVPQAADKADEQQVAANQADDDKTNKSPDGGNRMAPYLNGVEH